MAPDIQDLLAFVAVVKAGGFREGARVSGRSASSLSDAVRRMEGTLGVRLLNRTTRRQRLTEFGTAYYQRCLEVLGLVADSERMAEQSQDTPSGTLRITAPLTFGTEKLAPALSEFALRYPQVKLDVMLSNGRPDLLENGLDVAFRLGAIEPSNMIARPLIDYTLTMCASPDYLARRGNPQTPEDLRQHDCLAFAYPAGDDWHSVEKHWRLSGPDGEVMVAVSGTLLINSSAGLHQAARTGMGIVMLPDALVEQDLANGQLVALMPDYQLPSRPMSLIYAQDRYRLPKLRHFVDFAMQLWGKQ